MPSRTGSRRARARTEPGRRASRRWAVAGVLLLAALAASAAFAGLVASLGVPPRSLAPHVAHRLSGHHPWVSQAGEALARRLVQLDRGDPRTSQLPELRIGAGIEERAASGIARPGSRAVSVASVDDVRHAVAQARPGDVINLAPGVYRLSDRPIDVAQAGSPQAGIMLRAERPGTVLIEIDVAEGFVVRAPHWTFEHLALRGVCAKHSDCEHAFHVVGPASRFALRNSTLTDFNAHIKINGQHRRFPDHGLIEANTLVNAAARRTDSPVTAIDLVGASGWTIRGNLIADFAKAEGDRISYGAFAKGGGSDNRFQRNAVLCEWRLRGAPGWRVGLSLGGGGTGDDYCREGRCITEQDGAVIDSNLIASCSDDGIYVNRSATSTLVHNTLLDTGGISVRFPESSAEVRGNLVDGAIHSRDGGLLHEEDNLHTGMTSLYLGWHPQRRLFRDAGGFDFAWNAAPPRRASAAASAHDLCGAVRPAQPTYGAFEDFTACFAAPGSK